MLHGITRLGIHGMRIFLSALIIEITVVAAGSHRDIRHVQRRLQFMAYVQGIIRRFDNPYPPGHATLIDAARHDLTSDLHHEVRHTSAAQEPRHDIGAISLGNG